MCLTTTISIAYRKIGKVNKVKGP